MYNSFILLSSDSEDDVVVEKHKKTEKVEDNKKLNFPKKRKLSVDLSKEKSSKKNKILPNEMVFLDPKIKAEICSDPSMKDLLNIQFDSTDCLKINSENNTSNSNCSLSKDKIIQNNESTNKSSKKNEVAEQSKNEFLFKPSSSQTHQTRKVIKPQLIVKEKITIPDTEDDIFVKFIEVCLKTKSDDITKKILQKVQKRYNHLDSISINNDKFKVFLNGIIKKILNNHEEKFYTYIQEVNDEIKLYYNESRISPKSKLKIANKVLNQKSDSEEIMAEPENELSQSDMEKVRKLEKTIEKCQNKIRELETQEVDFDNEEESIYLQEDRYKRKLIELCALLSKIVGDNTIKRQIYKKKLRRKDIPSEMTGVSAIDNAIIDFINISIKKVNRLKHIRNHTAIADYLPVPDFEDIYQCISKCNIEKNLGFNKIKIKELTRTAFESIVKYLKKQRILENKKYMLSYLENEEDPAENNDELNKILQKNKLEGDKKLEKIFQKYVEKEEESLTQKQIVSENSSSGNLNYNECAVHESDKNKDKKKLMDVCDENKNSKEQIFVNKENIIYLEKKNDSLLKDTICQDEEKHSDEEIILNTNKKKELAEENELCKKKNKNEEDKDKHQEGSCQHNNSTELQYTCNNSTKKIQENQNIIEKSNICKKPNFLQNNLDENSSIKFNICSVNDLKKIINEDVLNISEIFSTSTNSNNDNKIPLSHESNEIEILSDDDKIISNNKLNTNLKTEEIFKIDNGNDNHVVLLVSENDKNIILEHLKNKNKIDLSKVVSDKSENEAKNKCENKVKYKSENVTDLQKTKTVTKKLTCNKSLHEIVVKKKAVVVLNKLEDNFSGHSNQNNNKYNFNDTINKNKSIPNNTLEIKNVKLLPNPLSMVSVNKQIKMENLKISTQNEIESSTLTNNSEKTIGQNENKKEIVEFIDIDQDIEMLEIHKEITENIQSTNIDSKNIHNEEQFDTVSQVTSEQEESTSFIKVCSFAKPPDTWKDSLSPNKSKQNRKILSDKIPNSECVDLTNEEDDELPSTSTTVINSLATNNYQASVKNVVVVKNIINNYSVPFSQNNIKNPKIAITRNIQLVNSESGKRITYLPKISNLLLNQVSVNNLNQNSLLSNVKGPLSILQKKQNPK